MRIVHISTFDVLGGAARAAFRLHKGLLRLGHESLFYVSQKISSNETVRAFVPPRYILSRLFTLFRREFSNKRLAPYRNTRPEGYELFSTLPTHSDKAMLRQIPDCDIVNLHWVANFVNYRPFFTVMPRRTPIVWTFHDMNPLTGGCHYDEECGKYMQGCGACPQLGSGNPKDLSFQMWRYKQKSVLSIPPTRFSVVAPSRWLAARAKESAFYAKFRVELIPYGIDLEDFKPRNRLLARDMLGIPQNEKVVLFVSDWIHNRRKGLQILIQCMEGLSGQNDIFFVSMGKGNPPSISGIKYLSLGHVEGDRFLSLVYSAADVFVIPSSQDNLPNTVIESLACGTPVVGFNTGGIPDMVRPSVTGLLAPKGNALALKSAILNLIRDDNTLKKMSTNCREIAETEYSLETQAKEYLELYKEILAH
jgi:glycosyltransferase involved in cell wall biosynthesis